VTRVVAGVARGRRLQVPPGGTRPTSDRAREGLFSSLQSLVDLEGARVVDLYAGSGALGLEALSRGAAGVTLVERDPAAVRVLQANVAAVGLPGAEVVADDVAAFLRAAAATYDLALLDPPYDDDVDAVLAALVPRLAPDAVVVAERRSRGAAPTWPPGVQPVRSRRYGEAVLWYARALRLPTVRPPS
jgi:16S rRNA (guanine966-N2)-methyltransferase